MLAYGPPLILRPVRICGSSCRKFFGSPGARLFLLSLLPFHARLLSFLPDSDDVGWV